MTYSETQLNTIEEMAGCFMRISDIAVMLDVPADVLRSDIADRSSEAARAYRRGKVSSKLELMRNERKLAQLSSPLAIENSHRYLLDMEDDE